MQQIRLFIWWGIYLVCALMLQRFFPGFDALVPGFLLAMQSKRYQQLTWLFVLFTLIQEGTGSLIFGTSLLWYGGIILLFHLSARLFVADNLLFISMLSISLGAYHALLIWLMTSVQDLPFDYTYYLAKALQQAILTPILWGIAYYLRPRQMRYVH